MSLVGEVPNLVIDFEMYNPKIDSQNKDEGELNAGKRLLNKTINKQEGFIDIVTYDALACNSKFINQCIELGVDAVIRVKKNKSNSLKEVKRLTNRKAKSIIWQYESYKIEIYETEFYMTGVNQPLRYIKYAKKEDYKERSQILIVTTCLEISLKTLHKIIKARWDIENSIFNNLKTEANLDHCFVHGGNSVEAIIYLIFISSNLFQLFKQRRIKNHIQIQNINFH